MNHSIQVKELENKYLKHILTILRDKKTDCSTFRSLVKEAGRFIAYEISNFMETEKVTIETPLNVKAEGLKIKNMKNIILVAILRASLPMINGALDVFYTANVGFVSAKRVETEEIDPSLDMDVRIDYYNLPPVSEKVLVIMDPMLATGSTLIRVLKKIYSQGKPQKTYIASIIATPYGIKRILDEFPDVTIITIQIDKELNKQGYIVPGLGDAGDRSFNCL